MSEWQSAGRLLGRGLGTVVDTVADMHDTSARHVESYLPPGISHVAAAHRTWSRGVYRTVSSGHRAVPAALGQLAPTDGTPVSSSKIGRAALPILNGLWGDAMGDEALAISMSLREDGRDVADATPAAPTGRLAFFVHGLFEDERVWLTDDALGTRLAADGGFSALYVRYNTGLRISENGRLLSELVSRTVHAWPVPVTSIALIGHSMGGLVSRSAGHHGQQTGAEWLPLLQHVISLGSPHLGSPVEKSVHVSDWVLRRIPHTRPLGEFVARRSVGIQDLRFGALVEADWQNCDPDDFLRDRCTEVPLLDHVTYCWIAGLIAADEGGATNWLFGDGIVRSGSAAGRGRARRIDLHTGTTVTGTNHFSMLGSEAVAQHVRGWLAAAS